MAFSPETYAILKGKIKQLEEEIAALTGPTNWLGITTTPIVDGSTVNPIVINGKNVTATDGSITSYNGVEFVFTSTIWQEFGRDSSEFVTKAGLSQTTGNAMDNAMSQKAVSDALQQKQDTLTFDNAPTQNSDNPVKSKGIYKAIQDAISGGSIDDEVTEESANPVKSSGIYDAIHGLKLSITNGYLTLNEELQFSMELTEDALSMIGNAEINDDTIIVDGPVAITNNSMVYPA